jgi:hypothetical protein
VEGGTWQVTVGQGKADQGKADHMKILHGSSNLALYWRFSVKMLQNGIISADFDIYPH